ncbi:hypothetical protein BDQ12DRAFT_627394 [Crucibulum laeve]|uniref:Uncharacterized protein n=1 Tax=Crucibulum laeve TaxID=68775 RepID=A0A5C3MHU2_9AGAR|nr:hypothetical protein BDQ12DRAFT_627394 [Crucibulum laeve]
MSSAYQQQQHLPPDNPCLRFPESLGLQREVNAEAAYSMLSKAHVLAQNQPFVWGYVDKPQEGSVILLYIPQQNLFPSDGIRYQDTEQKFTMTAGPTRAEIEVSEIKYGFVPNSGETQAARVRRRFRLVKGGDARLVLVHYSRGQPAPINPAVMNQPVRNYPLRALNEPPMFVIGEKAGQKVYNGPPPMHGGPSGGPPMPPSMGPMGLSQQQAMLAQQNNNMEILEQRRRERERRERSGSTTTGGGRPPPRPEDDDSGDETDLISTRTLAMTRYRRNHELMNEVFKHAAYGDKNEPERPSPYSIFSKPDLEDKVAKLQAEIEELKAKSASRKESQSKAVEFEEQGDVSMTSFSDPITV